MKTISDLTPLIPEIIAETVVKSLPSIYSEEKESAEYLVNKAEAIFKNNQTFRRRLKGSKGREYLYVFMVHWLKGYLLDKGCPRSMLPA